MKTEEYRKQIQSGFCAFTLPGEQPWTLEKQFSYIKALSGTMLQIINETEGTEYRNDHDLAAGIQTMLNRHGLSSSSEGKRLSALIQELAQCRHTLKAGICGEKKAGRQLRTILRPYAGWRLLANITLTDCYGDSAEYDSILIAPSGIRIFEVKHYNGERKLSGNGIITSAKDSSRTYNLKMKFSQKTQILRNVLKTAGISGIADIPCEVYLYQNGSSPIACSGTYRCLLLSADDAAERIDEMMSGKPVIRPYQLSAIADVLNAQNHPVVCPGQMDYDLLVESFISVMCKVQEARCTAESRKNGKLPHFAGSFLQIWKQRIFTHAVSGTEQTYKRSVLRG